MGPVAALTRSPAVPVRPAGDKLSQRVGGNRSTFTPTVVNYQRLIKLMLSKAKEHTSRTNRIRGVMSSARVTCGPDVKLRGVC